MFEVLPYSQGFPDYKNRTTHEERIDAIRAVERILEAPLDAKDVDVVSSGATPTDAWFRTYQRGTRRVCLSQKEVAIKS